MEEKSGEKEAALGETITHHFLEMQRGKKRTNLSFCSLSIRHLTLFLSGPNVK